MTVTETIDAITLGELDHGLESILAAAQARRLSIGQGGMRIGGRPTFRIGQTVVLNDRTRPRYMIGLRGIVTKVNAATVKIELTPESRAQAGRFGGSPVIGVPVGLVDLLLAGAA